MTPPGEPKQRNESGQYILTEKESGLLPDLYVWDSEAAADAWRSRLAQPNRWSVTPLFLKNAPGKRNKVW